MKQTFSTFLCIISIFAIMGCKSATMDDTATASGSQTTDTSTGSLTGKALFAGQSDNSGIIISVDKIDGTGQSASVYKSISESRSVIDRAIVAQITTNASGSYTVNNLATGTYTIYASSSNSLEKAVYTGVSVVAGRAVTVTDLNLTQTGSITGTATLAGAASGNLGILVYIAGTSYGAMTKADGSYTISGVPVGTGYLLVAGYQNYANSIPVSVAVTAGTAATVAAINLVKTSALSTVTGSVTGSVTLWDKAANDNAGIMLYLQGTSFLAMSDANGAYTLSGIPPGTYALVANKTGYADSGKSVTVTANNAAAAGALNLTIPAPANVIATGGNASTIISWNSTSSASSYNLYWSNTTGVTKSSGTKIAGVTSPYNHASLTNSSTYYYIITAVNGSTESLASSQASASCSAAAAGTPTGVTATGGDTQATITWADVASATSYNIYWSPTNGVSSSNGTKVTGATSPCVLTGLTNQTTYYFVVTAICNSVESAASSQVNALVKITAPAAPASITALAGNSQTTLTWPSVSGATSYNMYWSTTTGVTKTSTSTITKVTGVTSPYVQAGRSNGVSYYYILTAVNAGGESVASDQVTAKPQVPAPSAPVATAAGGNALNTVTWATVSGAASYNLYWSTTTGVTTTSGTKVSEVTTPYSHTALTNGSTYYYVVTAVNAGGESAASGQVSASPQIPLPPVPAGLVAVGGNANATISWNDIPAATSYNLYWSTSSTFTTANGTKIPGVTNPYTQTGLTNGTTYYYQVTAVNGGGESAASTQSIATPQVPQSVYKLTLVASFNSPDIQPIDLAWDGTNLWLAGGSNDSIYKIDQANGLPLESHKFSGDIRDGALFPDETKIAGLAFSGTSAYIIKSSRNTYNDYVASMKMTLSPLNFVTNTIGTGYSIEAIGCPGATFDGANLWALSNGTILKIDSTTGATLLTFSNPPNTAFTGITLSNDKTQFYLANSPYQQINKVYIVKKSDGSVLGSAALPYAAPPAGYGLRGICNDGTYLWLTDINTQKIYKCQLDVQ